MAKSFYKWLTEKTDDENRWVRDMEGVRYFFCEDTIYETFWEKADVSSEMMEKDDLDEILPIWTPKCELAHMKWVGAAPLSPMIGEGTLISTQGMNGDYPPCEAIAEGFNQSKTIWFYIALHMENHKR